MKADAWLGALFLLSICVGGRSASSAVGLSRLEDNPGGISDFDKISHDGTCISRTDIAAELRTHFESKAPEQDAPGSEELPGAGKFIELAEIFSESVVFEQADADNDGCISRNEFSGVQRLDSDVEVEGLRGAVDEVLFKATWADIDAKGAGVVSFAQFAAAMKVPIFISQAVFEFADTDMDGLLSHAEFNAAQRSPRERFSTSASADVISFVRTRWEAFEQAEARREFLALDSDNNHVITRGEGSRYMGAAEVDKMFSFADADKNDLLSLSEFSAVGRQQAADDAFTFLLRPLGSIPLLASASPPELTPRRSLNSSGRRGLKTAEDTQTDMLRQQRPQRRRGIQDLSSPERLSSRHSSFQDRLKHVSVDRERLAENFAIVNLTVNSSNFSWVQPRNEHVHLIRRRLHMRHSKQQHDDKPAHAFFGSPRVLPQSPQPPQPPQPPQQPQLPQQPQQLQQSQRSQQHRPGQLRGNRLPWLWRRQMEQPLIRNHWTQQQGKASANRRGARAFKLVLGRHRDLTESDAHDASGLPHLFDRRAHKREASGRATHPKLITP